MSEFLKKHSKSIELIACIVISYILIKLINNSAILFRAIDSLYNILSPFIIAFIFAYALNPIMSFIERKFKLKRQLSILITYLLIIITLVLISTYLIPKIYNNLIDISSKLPIFATDCQQWFNGLLAENKNLSDLINSNNFMNLDAQTIVTKVKDIAIGTLNVALSSTISITSYFIKIVLGFLISIYVLYDKEKFKTLGKKSIMLIFRKKWGTRAIEFLKTIDKFIGAYIFIKAIDSLIIGILAFIGLTLMGSKYSLIIAIIAGITNMIPYVGPFIGMATGFIINVFFNFTLAIFVFLFLFLLQQFDSWFLDPKLIGNHIGLSPYFVILAVTIGGGFYGPIGMILAVPIMAVIKVYWQRIVKKIDSLYKKVLPENK
ncbi:AI-2E family transporter [Inconstantimicrobium mannanitabidum]|uniref:Transporter n=1 Tax=Inconstantimicrobium mannanitabidum TaxID=1604901 RepID=A0ACB5RCQ0_9CLOT|nr:AI-2E family transporter [Clostridium sp. TW13]GKX66587.1 transporter [Clostridium sp. TW13]